MKTMTLEAHMRAVFAALAQDDMDALISHWAQDGVYYNPTVGPPAEGADAVYSTVGKLARTLKERGEEIVVDRITEVPLAQPPRAYVEWHIEAKDTASARHGKLGLHVISFNEDGFFHRVTVFSHP